MPKILATRNPSAFRTRQVSVRHDDRGIHITPFGPELSFAGMMQLRKPVDRHSIHLGLASEGYNFANLGVSSVLTTYLDGREYLILVRQDRPDFGDSVAKLLSGYMPSDSLVNPLEALAAEVSEEFLPCSDEEVILSGLINGRALPKPFADSAKYEPGLSFQMVDKVNLYNLPDVHDGAVFVGGKQLAEGSPRLYYDATKNSAQLVFNYHINFPVLSAIFALNHGEAHYLRAKNGHLHHSEEVRNGNLLEVVLHYSGILLVELDKGSLTPRVFTFSNGAPLPFTGKVLLSEAFAPKTDGVVSQSNISLEDYLARMRATPQ